MTKEAAKRTVQDVFDVLYKAAVGLCLYFLVQLVNEVKDMHHDVETSMRRLDVHDVQINTHTELLRGHTIRLDRIQNVSTIN